MSLIRHEVNISICKFMGLVHNIKERPVIQSCLTRSALNLTLKYDK